MCLYFYPAGIENAAQSPTTLNQGKGAANASTVQQSPAAPTVPDNPTPASSKPTTTVVGNDAKTTGVDKDKNMTEVTNDKNTSTEQKTNPPSENNHTATEIASSADKTPEASQSNVTAKQLPAISTGKTTPSQVASSHTTTHPPPVPSTTFVKMPELIETETHKSDVPDALNDVSTLNPFTIESIGSDLLQSRNRQPDTPTTEEDDLNENDGDDDYNSDVYDIPNNEKDQKQPVNELDMTSYKEADNYNSEQEDSHFFFHLIIVAFLVAIVYITYHNKRKVSVGLLTAEQLFLRY